MAGNWMTWQSAPMTAEGYVREAVALGVARWPDTTKWTPCESYQTVVNDRFGFRYRRVRWELRPADGDDWRWLPVSWVDETEMVEETRTRMLRDALRGGS